MSSDMITDILVKVVDDEEPCDGAPIEVSLDDS